MDRFEQLQQMLANEPADSFLNYALALEYTKQGDLQKAIALIEQVIQRDEHYLGAYLQLGGLYEKNADLDKARKTYEKGIAIADKQKNHKAKGELATALDVITDN